MITLFKPWLFVTLGIVFNIIAAVLSHYVIGLNNQNIAKLENRIHQHDVYIQGQWRSKTSLDQSENLLINLLALEMSGSDSTNSGLQAILKQELETTLKNHQSPINLNQKNVDYTIIKNSVNRVRQSFIDAINDSYIERQDIEQLLAPLQQKNANMMSLSIFLQMTGLILVLSRDLFGR